MSTFWVKAVRPAARLGLKGPDAAALLQQAGIAVPAAPNRCVIDNTVAGAVRVLRLGNTEFVLEQDEDNSALEQVRMLAKSAGLRAWPVARADFSLLIGGELLFDRLSRVCAFDFVQLHTQPDSAVMTLMAEISVTFTLAHAAGPAAAQPQLRLWVDPGFATYLNQTLQSLSPDAPRHGVHA